jgi:hypothetical protein
MVMMVVVGHHHCTTLFTDAIIHVIKASQYFMNFRTECDRRVKMLDKEAG